MDGMEAKNKLENLDETKGIPIIALSAVLNEEDITSPFDGFLKKPVSKESLIFEMSKFLKFKRNPNSLNKEKMIPDNIGFKNASQKLIPEFKLDLNMLEDFEKNSEELKALREEMSKACKSMDIESIENLFDYLKLNKNSPVLIIIENWIAWVNDIFQSFDMNKLSIELKKGLESIDNKVESEEKKKEKKT